MPITLSMQEITLIEEIWRVIVNKYFTAEFGAYDNIPFDFVNGPISPATLVFAIFIAAMTASSIAIFNKRVLGRLVRRLISREGVGYENAKTLEEVGLEDSKAIKLFINRYALMRAVRCREEDEFYGIDPSKCNEEIKSIGIENKEKIKVHFWARKRTLTTEEIAQTPEKTTDLEENSCVALSDVDSVALTDVDSVALNDVDSVATSEKDGDATKEGESEYVIEDSYAASLVADKKYKRKPTDHFYIRPSQKHRLSIRYDIKGTNPLLLLVVAAVCLIGGSLLIKIAPSLLEVLDGLLDAFNTY